MSIEMTEELYAKIMRGKYIVRIHDSRWYYKVINGLLHIKGLISGVWCESSWARDERYFMFNKDIEELIEVNTNRSCRYVE